MAILMLETNQRIINTDHIVTAYVTGREDDAHIVVVLTHGSPSYIDLPHHYKSFAKAETALSNLAKALVDAPETTHVMEMRVDGIYR
jgi:hypothetical protein